jgi:hypothetical protein
MAILFVYFLWFSLNKKKKKKKKSLIKEKDGWKRQAVMYHTWRDIYIYMQPPHLFGWVFNLWTAIHQSMDITLMQLGHTYTYKYCWGIAFSTMG